VFKFLNFKSNEANYKQICAGTGQALLYLNYGIDVTYLVLGVSEKADNNRLSQIINYVENLYLFLVYSGCRRFQFWIWNQKTNQLITSKEDYYMPKQVTLWWYITTLSKQDIFDNKFVWTKGKKFCEKYGIKYDEKKGCLRI
jgi:hypothetical protein